MNLDELRSVQAKERRKDSLQHLRDAFYDDVAAYLADLRAARDRRASEVDNPFSDDDVRRLSDEVGTAEEVAEALYERRVGKVVKLASFAAADMPVETEGMTSQERELFDDLVEHIVANKSTVLDALSGVTTPEQPGRGTPGESETDPTAEATDAQAPDPAFEPDGALAEAMGASTDTHDVAPEQSAESPAEPTVEPSVEEPARPTDSPITEPDPDAVADPDSNAIADRDPNAIADPDPNAVADRDPNAVGDPGPDHAAGEQADVSTRRGDGPVPVDPEPAPPGAVETDPTAETPPVSTDDDGSNASAATPRDSGEKDGPTPSVSTATADQDRTTVRITADVGEILGTDEREYHLTSEDVVSLPAANAEPLVKRDAAERID
ncbi:DNA replication complex subunit Gins51 [Halorubrum vacuolatum]|uniref:DNA replication factor GINS n=1 Tax=Halorubrum vacuolatum TaxID=63740 RepID=A0A238V7R7_HALVU|nr:hypothetical protein [Halorubrum vacuolatum]SNR30258.1 DNA replication factor GINS [Halorubrum vacuolatum]